MAIEMIGAFESTFQPAHDVDVAESTGHVERRATDLMLLRLCGVHRVRYPIRWHRLEAVEGRFDWTETDLVFEQMHEYGWHPIVDLVHHTSYPAWLTDGFADARFADAYMRYVTAVCERYPWIEEYTLFNEPFSTLFLCGHEGIWPPYHRGLERFVALLGNVLPAISAADAICRRMLPDARHLYVDSCERHTGDGIHGSAYAEYANDRRFVVLDALTGRLRRDDDRPFVDELRAVDGAEALFGIDPLTVDVLGLDYYAHCQWHFDDERGVAPTPVPPPLHELIAEYSARYELPVWLGETNLRGHPGDRATWLKYTLEQCEIAVAAGVDVRGYCWFPFVDSCDWDSLLFRSDRNIDPVGVFSIDPQGHRQPSTMSVAYARAGHGTTSDLLPAYRLQEPVAGWLVGWMPQMSHWQWVDPPAAETSVYVPGDDTYEPLTIRHAG